MNDDHQHESVAFNHVGKMNLYLLYQQNIVKHLIVIIILGNILRVILLLWKYIFYHFNLLRIYFLGKGKDNRRLVLFLLPSIQELVISMFVFHCLVLTR